MNILFRTSQRRTQAQRLHLNTPLRLTACFFVVDAFIVIVLLLLLVVPGTAGSDTIVTATVATYIRTVVNEFAEATNTADGIKK